MTSLYCLNPFVYPKAAVILISLTVSLYGSTVEETAYLILYSPACSNTYALACSYVSSVYSVLSGAFMYTLIAAVMSVPACFAVTFLTASVSPAATVLSSAPEITALLLSTTLILIVL